MPRPRAEIVCVGTELLAGGRVNTHASYLAPRLAAAGYECARQTCVPDSRAELRDAVRAALARSAVVLVTGGLGPTFDDLTREACAEAAGVALRYRPELYARIRRKYRRFRLRIPANNRRQAWLLDGARALANPNGSAPGQFLSRRPPEGGARRWLFLLPGPPAEMVPMFEACVLPRLRRRAGAAAHARRAFHFCGVAEAEADRRLAPVLRRWRGKAEFTILANLGLVDLHAEARGAGAVATLDAIERQLAPLLGRHFYGADGATLASAAGAALLRRGWRLALAESCTGGLLAQQVSAPPGASAYFSGAVVAYADGVKRDALGVSPELLRRHGAVSEPVARALAEGARLRLGAEAALSVTGVAGPGGGSRAKPVGLVYIGVALPGLTRVYRFHFPGTRAQVRERAAQAALFLLLRNLNKGALRAGV